ncbi:MAG: hypothetical protein KGP35_00205 [Bacteroidetes bacterium]|nr:hypothetical protein [Bacteroidota bacterium]
MCGAGKAERAERSGLPRFFFGYFLCSNDKESNNKNSGARILLKNEKDPKKGIKIFNRTAMPLNPKPLNPPAAPDTGGQATKRLNK